MEEGGGGGGGGGGADEIAADAVPDEQADTQEDTQRDHSREREGIEENEAFERAMRDGDMEDARTETRPEAEERIAMELGIAESLMEASGGEARLHNTKDEAVSVQAANQ